MSNCFSKKDIIYTIYKEGGISKAAQRLYVSQPSLSAMVKKVEDEIGLPLFDRTVKPIRLTETGKEYIKAAESILAIENGFDSYIDSVNNLQRGSVRIGSNQLLSSLVLPAYISSFISDYPNIQLSLTDANSVTLADGLMSGDLDLIIDNHRLDPDLFEMKHISTEHLLLAVPKKLDVSHFSEARLSAEDIIDGRHLSHDTASVTLEAFRDIPFILMTKENDTREHTDKLFDSQRFAPKVILEIDRLVTLYAFIRLGTAASIVSDTLIRNTSNYSGEVVFYKIDDRHSVRNIYVSYRRTKYITKAMDLFIRGLNNCIF